ncbi:ABC transporter ATP-binding protein [Limimaricola litoreus]|uniref:Sn-glycerol-3-phosphate ABC transporter ATP-binding protein UgpC n=1 Tax=Limimaricola litoreus TaxID=2955316 RepID=A0A9X2FRJ5_9RHOB|nr:sn-glycerol-3-phosphate ABC transporter ATP-binding protein UgpC [Limimaricola litoreus]MCP1170632.1 sn-glycerol-3-phosphate ABC transporter ATP-binding protein UgpC [Limimaricola litoreus]
MATIEFRNVTRHFPGTHRAAVEHLNLPIEDGEFVVLVGPSGCGKSTSLRMLSGLELVDSGEILIDGKDISRARPSERDVAMVFQNYALYPHMTVADNMGFHLRIAKRPKSEIRQKVEIAAEKLGLTPFLDRYPRNLSGGQRQRVAMGRAIVRTPKVYLFDEPLSNLDAKLRVQMRGEIKKLQGELGTTTVYVTHDQIEAMTMADRIAVMSEGKLEQYGTPTELYDRPVNTFVAGFIGSPGMNFIEGAIDADGGHFHNDAGLRLALDGTFTPGRKVTIGIRPEHLRLAEDGFGANVDLVEPTGAEEMIVFDIPGGQATASLRERNNLRKGQKVGLTAAPGHVHVFCGENGNRLEGRT